MRSKKSVLKTSQHSRGSFRVTANGWVFVSGFALHDAQFKGQKLMAKLAQIPCYLLMRLIKEKLKLEHETKNKNY